MKINKKLFILISATAILGMFGGCNNPPTSEAGINSEIPYESVISGNTLQQSTLLPENYIVKFEQEKYELKVGETLKLEPVVAPDNYDGLLRFKSSNPDVAETDENGIITATGKGAAVITVWLDNEKTAECTVNVVSANPAENITLVKKSGTLGVGETQSLAFKLEPEGADRTEVSFESLDEKVASVDENGKLEAIGKGKTKITLSLPNGKSIDYTIEVMDSPKAFSLQSDNTTLYYGQSAVVKAVFDDGEYSNKITYSSSDTSVATVNSFGKITPKGKGRAKITATAHNGVKSTLDFEIKGAYVTDISITDNRNIYGVGEKHCIGLSLEPAEATLDDIEFSSSNENVLDIDKNGNCTFKSSGTVSITVTASNGRTVSRELTVKKAPSTVILSHDDITLYRNQMIQLSASFKSDEMKSAVTYTSSNPSIASVDENGKVQTSDAGQAVITAKAYNGVSSSLTVTVDGSHTYANSISVSKPSEFMKVGQKYCLKVDVSPSYVPVSDISFKSSNPDVLTVDDNGNITVHNIGMATVTATSFNGVSATDIISITTVNYMQAYNSHLVYEDLNKLESIYPDLIHVSSIGQSVQGRDIPLVTLGKGEKKACIVAGIHSREHISISFTMRSIEEYAQAYSSGGKYGGYDMKELLDTYTLYIVPMVNPDGTDISTAGNEPSVEITSLVKDSYKGNANGVNLNRNFPFEWSAQPLKPVPSEQYRGSKAGSEPETQAIIKLCEENDFEWLLDMHIVGNGIYWRDSKNGVVDGDYAFTSALANKCGYRMFETTTSSPDYAGGLENWFRAEYKKPGLCIELIPSDKIGLSKDYIGFNRYFEEAVVWNKTKYTFAEAIKVTLN